MTNYTFAVRSHIRNVVLCALATLTLAACGGEDGSNGSAATTAADTATPSTATAPVTATASNSGSTTATTPATVAETNKVATPVNTATTSGVATLDWMPPTENNDGSALTNLAGYTVYYGTSPGSLTQSVKITNPGLSAYTMTDLPSGTWYFAVTSYSSTGVESSRTNTVSTTI